LINQLANNDPVALYYDGDFHRDYLYVDDAVKAIDLCVARAPTNSIINIGTGDKVLFRDVIVECQYCMGYPALSTASGDATKMSARPDASCPSCDEDGIVSILSPAKTGA